MRIALDGVVLAKLSPRSEVDLHGTGDPQTMTAWFAGASSNSLTVVDPGAHELRRVRASFVPRWKELLMFLALRRPKVVLTVIDTA